MLTEQRQAMILELLEKQKSITVFEIKKLLDISESTIRRDLNQLDKEGKLQKVFGGAVALDNEVTSKELSVSQKIMVNEEQKRRIAGYAVSLLEPSDYVYLDAGTTTGYMIDYINCPGVTFVTNAVDHARRLAGIGYAVILVGGTLKGKTEAVVGSQAILTIEQFHFSKGFFGVNGIRKDYGYMTPDRAEALVKKTAFEHCNQPYILADASKFDEVSPVTFAPFLKAKVITERIPMNYTSCENLLVAR